MSYTLTIHTPPCSRVFIHLCDFSLVEGPTVFSVSLSFLPSLDASPRVSLCHVHTHTVFSFVYIATPLPATFSSRYRLGLRAPFELRVLPRRYLFLPPSSWLAQLAGSTDV